MKKKKLLFRVVTLMFVMGIVLSLKDVVKVNAQCVSNKDVIEETLPEKANEEEVREILEDKPQLFSLTPDNYEGEGGNDTINTAYPYNQVPAYSTKITGPNQLFRLGMKNASLHSDTDVDWYKLELKEGERCFVDIRNLEGNWNIRLYYYNKADNDSLWYYQPKPETFDNKSEKYMTVVPKQTGTFYLRVTSDGDWMDTMNYFFYAGPEEQIFTVENLPTYGSAQIYGGTYKSYTVDLTEVVPKYSEIISLSITDSFSSGTSCSELDKRLTAGLRSYYNTAGTGSATINYISGVQLGQVWDFAAKCNGNKHVTVWSAKISGKIRCKMAPYSSN